MMYSFDNNAVTLSRENSRYIIYIKGKKNQRALSDEQLCNPLIAVNEFTSEINTYLRKKVKAYLSECNENRTMGCTVECHSCVECRDKQLNRPGTRCPLL